jgi:hypothetical protein
VFDPNFAPATASAILANQHRLAVQTVAAALQSHPPEGSEAQKFFSEHAQLLMSNPQHIHHAEFIERLVNHSLTLLKENKLEAAKAWGRCAYVVTRRFAHGWLSLLDVLMAARVFRPVPLNDEVPKYLGVSDFSPIPKRIIQYWDKPVPPPDVSRMIESWRQIRGYSHRLFSHDEARRYLDLHFGRRVLKAYDRATHVAGKADLFRLAWLYQRGGIYADADEKIVGKIGTLFPRGSRFVLTWSEGSPPCINNWFIAAAARDRFIEASLMLAIKRIEGAVAGGPNPGAWMQTGPGVLTMVLLDDWALHGRPVLTSDLYLMREADFRTVVQTDEFLEYRKHPTGNWRLEKLSNAGT